MAVREGYRLPVFETEIGTIGFILGWDLAFPEVARSLVLDGADLLCVLGCWEKEDGDEWKTLLKARAYENACFVAGANRVGEDVTITFGGESMIVSPRGKVLASMPTEIEEEKEKKEEAKSGDKEGEKEKPKEKKEKFVEGYCVARIDLDDVKKQREERLTLQARQPTSYRNIVRKY
jgi:predicted amidohydrolase